MDGIELRDPPHGIKGLTLFRPSCSAPMERDMYLKTTPRWIKQTPCIECDAKAASLVPGGVRKATASLEEAVVLKIVVPHAGKWMLPNVVDLYAQLVYCYGKVVRTVKVGR